MRPYKNCSYMEPSWQAKLAAAGLPDFASLWKVELPWVEAPNYRRGGWSGVMRHQLDANDPDSVVYIKRQQDHVYKSLGRHYRRGLPTFYREARSVLYLQTHGIPVASPIFFDMRREAEHQQAILITRALIGYRSLEDWLGIWHTQGFPNRDTSLVIVAKLASVIRKMHDLGYRHGALKPKHVFVCYDEINQTADIRLLDFEASRFVRYKHRRIMHDLMSMYTKCRNLPARYYYHFLKHYLQVDVVTAKDFKLVRAVRQFRDRTHFVRNLRDFLLRRQKNRA